jgi:hypothetical protein
LRETRRSNRDGSVVRYLQLAHNERHPVSGSPVAKVIHNFGRAEKVDRAALARLVSSISRFLTPEEAAAAAHGAEVEVLDSRRLGGTWTLDRVWERLGISAAIRKAAVGRRLDGEAVERVVFALVAQRALEPGSKLAGTKWVAERVAIEGCEGFTDDAAYAAMDFLLEALDDIAAEVFASVAHLLNLDLDIVFVDTTSTYWEVDVPDELAQLEDKVDDDGVTRPAEPGSTVSRFDDLRCDLLILVWGWGVREPPVCPALPLRSFWLDLLVGGSGGRDAGWRAHGEVEQVLPGLLPGPLLGQVQDLLAG